MENKLIIIFCAPSGSGKTVISQNVVKNNNLLEFSISATTRQIRTGEKDSVDYYFMDNDTFLSKVENNEFLEYEQVYNNIYYGTLFKEINNIHNKGKIPVLDMDVKGAKNLKKKYPNSIAIFIKVKDLDTLKQRLIDRNTETLDAINMRIEKAKTEIEYENMFDYVLINNDLDVAIEEITNYINNHVK